MPESSDVEIFTDGACRGNPGPGGWAAILRYRGVEKELSGYEPDTTNNQMETWLEEAGLAHRRQAAGQEHRSLATARCSRGTARGRLGVGARSRWPSRERTGGRAGSRTHHRSGLTCG